jgi:hypothetical protein
VPKGWKTVKKPVNYIVVNKQFRVIGKSHKLSAAVRIAGRRKNAGIAQISMAWEKGKVNVAKRRRKKKR